jgi:hypothetical protein
MLTNRRAAAGGCTSGQNHAAYHQQKKQSAGFFHFHFPLCFKKLKFRIQKMGVAIFIIARIFGFVKTFKA